MTSRRALQDRALPPPARGPPSPTPRCAGPPRWWCRAGHRRRSGPDAPSRAGSRGPPPAPSPTRRKHPQADPGRPRHPGVNRTARHPCSSGYFLGAGTTPHPFHEFKPSTTPRAIQADKLLTATYPWLLTYDDQEIIWANLYNAARCARFNIAHTAAIQHVGKETIVYGPTLTVPTGLEITPGVHATWIA